MEEGLIVFIIFVGMIAVTLGAGYFIQKATVAAMRRLAAELGYEFTGGGEGGGAETSALPGPLARLVAFMAPWRIEGREGSTRVSIYTITRGSGRSRSTYTVVEAGVHPALGFKMTIAREGFFSKIGKTVFGMQDIQVGDEEFDRAAIVKGDDPEAIKRLLSSQSLRDAILRGLQAYPSLEIGSGSVKFERSGIIKDPEFYKPLIASMAEIARAMGG
jgi:hypothetical protein